MKKLKKILAVALTIVMLLTAMPVTSVFAEEVYQELKLDTLKTVSVNGEDTVLSFSPEKDGFYKFISTGSYDTVATLYDGKWNKLNYGDDSKESSNFEIIEKLSAGCVYYLGVNTYSGTSASFKVKVTETVGIASATVTQYPFDMTCVEDYESRTANLNGLEMTFTTTEGEEMSWAYGDYPYVGDFVITYYDYEVGEDGYFYVDVKCGGEAVRLQYTIVENPVESIEYHSKKDIVLYENCGGYDLYDKYVYNYEFPSDAVFVINFKDGTSVKCEKGEEVNGEVLYTYTNQYENPWSVGTNYVYATYMGIETAIPVYVKSCPFKSITINSTPSREYILGDEKYGYYNANNKYIFEPTDITGLSFTVVYEDGRKELFNDMDFDIENQTIAGIPYSFDENWAVRPNTVLATLHFMGAEIKYNVNVVESPLKYFEMTWYPELTDYEDRYEPVFDGMEFTLTFKDGTKETVVLSDENTSYGTDGWLSYEISVGDYTIEVYQGWNEYDEIIYGFSCLGKWIDYEGIWFNESREIENITVENFSPNADGMILHVEYTDGTEDTLSTKAVSSVNNGDKGYSGYVKTENGISQFSVKKIVEDGEVVGYTLDVLGEEVIVNGQYATLGDVDGDDNITIMDATAVQRHVAQQITLSGVNVEAADTDKDGNITVMDATLIQRYIAKEIEKF